VPVSSLARFSRPDDGRLVAGVSGGLARGFGLDVTVIRLAFLLLCLAGGVGAVIYGGLWLALPSGPGAGVGMGRHRIDDVGALVIVLGVMLVLRDAGIWFSDSVTLIGAVVAIGAVLIWGRTESADNMLRDRGAAARIAVGVFELFRAFAESISCRNNNRMGSSG